MRRFIDIVFVEPKNRQYVVLHQGKFWQLPRMNLTANAWDSKVPYTGTLDRIFVAQSQAVGKALSHILKTYELPEQLGGLPATHFLAWWENNDYRWLSENDVIKLDEMDNLSEKPSKKVANIDDEMRALALKKAQLIMQNPNFANANSKTTKTDESTSKPKSTQKTDVKVGHRTPTKKKSAPQTTPNKEKTKAKPSSPKSARTVKLPKTPTSDGAMPATQVNTPTANTKTTPTPPISQKSVTPKKQPSGDIFDNLLEDLMDDLNQK